MIIKPQRDKVLLQLSDEVEQIGAIHIPELCRATSKLARVLAVGPDVKDVTQGDVVGIEWATGVELQIGGRECRFVRGSDVLFIQPGAE